MMRRRKYHFGTSRYRRASQRLFVVAGILLLLVVVGSVLVHRSYNRQLAPVSDAQSPVYVTIASGTPPADIAQLLYDKHLIRSADAFQWYVTSHNERDKLQAGTYRFSPSMSTAAIADMIAHGKIATDLVTIIPGQTLADIRTNFIRSGFKATDVDNALRADRYAGHPALADNPADATLEGFLYPDSYQKTATTDPSEIVTEALDEMQKHLTSEVRTGFAAQGLSVYQGVTLSSIIEQEVPKQADRAQVAQVFLKRLRENMTLGSDVTTIYSRSVNDPRYNTNQYKGLPPGPIGTVSDSSMQALARPAATDWLFFVSGDDGTTHFSKTLQEHDQNIAQYCHKLCFRN